MNLENVTLMASKAALELLYKNPESTSTIMTQFNTVMVRKAGRDCIGDEYTILGWKMGTEVATVTRDEAIRLILGECKAYTKDEATTYVKTARAKGMKCIYINLICDEDGNELGAWAGRGESPLTEEWQAEQHFSHVPRVCIMGALEKGKM